MTEAEWLVSSDPGAMLRRYMRLRSPCCGCLWTDNGDGTMSLCEGQLACSRCDNNTPDGGYVPLFTPRKLRLFACACMRLAGIPAQRVEAAESEGLPTLEEDGGRRSDANFALAWTGKGSGKPTASVKAALLRCIVGNPFRPLTLPRPDCPECGNTRRIQAGQLDCPYCPCPWLTPTVVSIAHRAYDLRDWDALPVLADALEEAGCTEQVLLQHLRGWEPCPCLYGYGPPPSKPQCSDGWVRSAGVYVRGDWAVDRLTGRS